MDPSAPLSYTYARTHATTKCRNLTQSMMCSSELSGGKQTSVLQENGNVYVNGDLVHQGLPADSVSVSTINGTVYINDVPVWPREAALEGSVNGTQSGPSSLPFVEWP